MTHRDTWQRTVDRLLFDLSAPWDTSASMTMHLYGHLITQNPWDAAAKFGAITRHGRRVRPGTRKPQDRHLVSDLGLCGSRLSESNRRPIHYE